jgi:uncharacterized protein (TIGR02246 family)
MKTDPGIERLIEELAGAWNRRDWQAFGRLLAAEADYVNGDGVRLSGRERIREALSAAASSSPDEGRVSVAVESVKRMTPEIAIVLCAWQRDRSGEGKTADGEASGGRVTMVLENGEDGWRIVALQNTDRKA